jgi:hypothetical protein
MAYLYRHIRLDRNEPFYIGIGSDEGGRYSRANRKTYRSNFWTSVASKTDYRVEILEEDLTWDEAKEKETWWILFYGRIDNGTGILVNLTDGGDGAVGSKISDATRKKLSETRKGKRYLPEGWKMTDEQKKVLSEKMKGREPSNKGVPLTEDQRNKISIKAIGRPSPKRKPVICIETGEIYPSVEHAERDPRFYIGGVSKVLNGYRKNLKGFHFDYYNPEEA